MIRFARPTPLQAASLSLAAAALALAGAWTFQALGFEPCELCLKERYAFYAALPVAAAAIFLARNAPPAAARTALALLALIVAANAALAFYHAGVEWKFWAGPADCTGDFVKPATMADFRRQLQSVHVVRCDEPALKILGLSLAFWNALLSAALSALAGLGAAARSR
ncbi:disulfide bond formation protein DsbB [Rhodoblastus acidophilus]|uniref:disulfide bond formation protein B n=1 Tax=Rhodoblastus acidophilus TaxID=1074 RepID=UPI0022256035|nr:disulfide bond formation protein B [Rhodoblastus acidophilus]MCW2314894.1 disulfide bond formation protein DsbB [Rhodoblastus acidophilus]